MPGRLAKVIVALVAASVGAFVILLVINILLFFKLKSMFRYGSTSSV